MQQFETKFIDVRVSTHQKRPQRAQVTPDGLFAIHCTKFAGINYEFWTVTHIPTGMALSGDHMTEREARAVLAVWRALPLPWQRKTAPPIKRAYNDLPPQLRAWITAIRKKGESNG